MADEEEISELRIRQIALERRSLYRIRSYFVIAAAACAVVAIQLAWMIIDRARAGVWDKRAVGYLLFDVLAIIATPHFIRRAVAAHREAARSRIAAPTSPPDFSTLGDGSQRSKNLENIE